MGTINYKTGDIITLGLDIMDFDIEIPDDIEENEREDYKEEEKRFYVEEVYDCVSDMVEDILNDISEEYFEIKIEYGYYEGFCVLVNRKYMTDAEIEKSRKKKEYPSFLLDMWTLDEEEREDIQAELRIIGKGLKKLTDTYLDVCYPSWCTVWEKGQKSNYKAIDYAIEEAQKAVEVEEE